MLAKLQSLIRLYDCIGWIPTIRGCLSLDLIDDAKSILGDVDKYSVRFKTNKGFHSQHYLIASALLTTNDAKAGKKIDRTYRYIFTGSINDDEITQRFLADNQLIEDGTLKEYLDKEGLLLGRLFIIFENDLTDQEASFLDGLKDLSEINKGFLNAFNVEAQSMEILDGYRTELHKKWVQLRDLAQHIETDEKNKRPTFSFDIALTRDGILLLKDVTSVEYRAYFAAPDSADDYTKNIPVHRLFKIAMNCVKYLFHSNYHHNEDHDTYLPASNLYPAKRKGMLDLNKVFKHQLDAFLVPVIKLKRTAFSSHTIESYGVLLYAKAFIKVFSSNELISSDEAEKAKEYTEILDKEVAEMTAAHRSLFNTLITQHNAFVIITALLAFVFTCTKLFSIFIEIPPIKIEHLLNIAEFTDEDNKRIFFDFVFIAILVIIFHALYFIPRFHVLRKKFQPKQKKKNFLFQNSCLKRKRFSLSYGLYIDYNTVKLQIKNTLYIALATIFYIFCFLGFSVALYFLIKLVL